MTDTETLKNLLGEWVTVRNPDLPVSWYGRLIAYHDDPGLMLTIPGRGGTCLPQRFTVTRAEPPAPVPAAEGLPDGALDSAEAGAAMLDAWAHTPACRNLLAHALAQLARDGWLRQERGDAFELYPDNPRADSPQPAPVDENLAAVGDVVHPDTNTQASTPPGVDEPGDVQRLDCPQRCEIPPGITLTEVPEPRHAWSDVHRCPNDGCGRTFLAHPTDPAPPA
ncbi:hypothetical protein [Streptomyces sp. SAI-127]|uniref:hypothetical protein n=1 Tax=Streptomyces sp. SAI-127 TaxID=2940543 RepID=UPI002474A253|nr:hypothetical protein [Streptomyces sp. SAI-127]MDH6489602.1 hypothetical protein [Streptomyces sp. SAI-127]